MANYTLAQLSQFKDNGLDEIINESAGSYPLVTSAPIKEVRGSTVKYPVITGVPDGSFRKEGEGVDGGSFSSVQRTASLAFCDCQWSCDELVAKGGGFASVEEATATMAEMAFQGALRTLERASFFGYPVGTGADFYGLDQAVLPTRTIDAGGGADAGKKTSVYLINWKAVKMLVASDLFDIGEIRKLPKTGSNGKDLYAYRQDLSWFAAFAVVNQLGVAKVANISQAHPCTDKLIMQAEARLSPMFKTDAIFMSSSSVADCQLVRSQQTLTGQLQGVPTCSQNGTPFYISSVLPNTFDDVVEP